jgi:SAM-dependent methyltransferase
VSSRDRAAGRNLAIFGGRFGGVYATYMERPWLGRAVSRLVWGSDLRPYYRSMAAIGKLPPGATVVDVPCGAGSAFRAVRPGQDVRYLAGDLSPRMLSLARRRARKRGLDQIELFEADAVELPLETGLADLFVSYFGLHCLDDPQGALREAHRCLASGRRLVGATIVTGPRLRQRLLVRPDRGAFGRVESADVLERRLGAAGFEQVEVERSGLFAYFRARAARR